MISNLFSTRFVKSFRHDYDPKFQIIYVAQIHLFLICISGLIHEIVQTTLLTTERFLGVRFWLYQELQLSDLFRLFSGKI